MVDFGGALQASDLSSDLVGGTQVEFVTKG